MMRMNNKGQSLVMFILIIPIFIVIFTLIYDISSSLYMKNRISNTNYLATNYALDKIDSINGEDVAEYIRNNEKNYDNIVVNIDNNEVDIKVTFKKKGIFISNDIVSEYKGSILDNEKKIERIK